MRRSIVTLAVSCLAGLAATSLGLATAEGAEAPSVTVQANAPGWITVYYSHSGTGEVREYKIQRQGGGGTTLYSPNGQWTDSHLEPDTQYAYTVCAVYDDGDEACSSPVAARTLPAPGKPANFDPPTITNVEVNENSIKVTWGPTGDYPSILVHLSDPEGNVDQRKLQNIPNSSQTFVGLRSGVLSRHPEGLQQVGRYPALVARCLYHHHAAASGAATATAAAAEQADADGERT